jgi:hypothetical protein
MSELFARAKARLAALQRNEALNTLAAVRRELTAALQEPRAQKLQLADIVRETETQLAEAGDHIRYAKHSIYWRVHQEQTRFRRAGRECG